MFSKLRRLQSVGVALLAGLSAWPTVVFAATEPKTLKNIGDAVTLAGKAIGFNQQVGDVNNVYRIIGQAILWVNALAGIIVLLFLIYGGWLWMTAEGNDEKVTQAKAILKTSFIALIIIFGAAAISGWIIISIGHGDFTTQGYVQ